MGDMNTPPDRNQPWVWLPPGDPNGKWYLVATDTSDGVPDSLDLPGGSDGAQA